MFHFIADTACSINTILTQTIYLLTYNDVTNIEYTGNEWLYWVLSQVNIYKLKDQLPLSRPFHYRNGLPDCRAHWHSSSATRILTAAWAPAGFFPGVGKLGGLETKFRQRGPGVVFRWGSGSEANRSRRKILKIIHKIIIGLLSVLL